MKSQTTYIGLTDNCIAIQIKTTKECTTISRIDKDNNTIETIECYTSYEQLKNKTHLKKPSIAALLQLKKNEIQKYKILQDEAMLTISTSMLDKADIDKLLKNKN